MVSRPPTTTSNLLTHAQRQRLVVNTHVSDSDIFGLKDKDINISILKQLPHFNLLAAGLSPLHLRARGARDASELVAMGFDTLHLVDAEFCSAAIAAFGAQSVVDAFLHGPIDAISIAGSCAARMLGLSTQSLLELCRGAPAEALAVLKVVSDPRGVHVSTLLDAGLRSDHLVEAGVSHAFKAVLIGTPSELCAFGLEAPPHDR